MLQKLYRVVCICVEMGDDNLIVSIYDQGVGGNCNVVKEIIYFKVFFFDLFIMYFVDGYMFMGVKFILLF